MFIICIMNEKSQIYIVNMQITQVLNIQALSVM